VKHITELKQSSIRKGYFIGETSSVEADRLAMFLNSDAYINPLGLKDWLDDTNYRETCINMTCLIKRGNKVHIYHEMDDEEDPKSPSFETTIENLKYILDRWAQALKEKPQKVIITQDDSDNVTVDFEN